MSKDTLHLSLEHKAFGNLRVYTLEISSGLYSEALIGLAPIERAMLREVEEGPLSDMLVGLEMVVRRCEFILAAREEAQ